MAQMSCKDEKEAYVRREAEERIMGSPSDAPLFVCPEMPHFTLGIQG